MTYSPNNIEISVVRKGTSGWCASGTTDFDSLDDVRSHLMGKNAWLRLFITSDRGVREYNIRCDDVSAWEVAREDLAP